MKIELEFTVSPDDLRKMAKCLAYAGEVELLNKEQDSAYYASDLLNEIADKLELEEAL
jgi:hypothetical protein